MVVPVVGLLGHANRPNSLLASQNSWRHQANPIHTRRMAYVDRLGNLIEAHFIVALYK
jgi:hypothetical protein